MTGGVRRVLPKKIGKNISCRTEDSKYNRLHDVTKGWMMAINNRGLWPFRVEVGDVIRSGSGDERVVRAVSHGVSGLTTHVSLAIRRCSWTRRPFTVLNYCDLHRRGFLPTGEKDAMSDCVSITLAEELSRRVDDRELFSWDVVGVR